MAKRTGPTGWRGRARRNRLLLGLAATILRDTVLILIAVDALFILQLMATEYLPHVLGNQGELASIAVFVVLAMPEALYIVLPLGLVIGTYLAVLRHRERNHLVALAGAGYGGVSVVGVAISTGLLGAALAVFLAGYVEPIAGYLTKLQKLDVTYHHLRDGNLAAGQPRQYGDYYAFVAGGRTDGVASRVVFLEQRDETRFHLTSAAYIQRLELDAPAKANLVLSDARAVEFRLEPETVGPDAPLRIDPLNFWDFNTYVASLPEIGYPAFPVRADRLEWQTMDELLAASATSQEALHTVLACSWRAALCLFAPLIGLFAVTATGRQTQAFALPSAALVVLLGSLYGPQLAGNLAALGPFTALAGLFAASATATLVAGALAARLIGRRLAAAGIWL